MALKQAVITGFLGETKDRFRSYNAPKTLEEKFSLMHEMKGIDGVEIVYPYEVNDPEQVKVLLGKNELNIAAINVNIKADDMFINGSISSPDAGIRKEAVRFIKEAKDFAEKTGADKVQCCPLGDGYEFHFQADYGKTWKHMVDALAEAGEYKQNIPLFIEYKPNEVRGKCFINSSAKTLCMLNDIGNKSVGTTIDFGHSIYGNENPAEALSLLQNSAYPYYVHINDNDGSWDWDYMVGTKHFLHYVEFLYYLKRDNYTDYLTSDTSPTRVDIKRCFEANARWTQKIWDALDKWDDKEMNSMFSDDKYMRTWDFLEENLFFGK